MAKLVIKDLNQDKALDERAMKAVAGGSAGHGLAARKAGAGAGTLKESRLIRGLLKTAPSDTD